MEVKIQGMDIVACVSVAVSGALIYIGHNGGLITLLSTIVGFYFGRKSAKDD